MIKRLYKSIDNATEPYLGLILFIVCLVVATGALGYVIGINGVTVSLDAFSSICLIIIGVGSLFAARSSAQAAKSAVDISSQQLKSIEKAEVIRLLIESLKAVDTEMLNNLERKKAISIECIVDDDPVYLTPEELFLKSAGETFMPKLFVKYLDVENSDYIGFIKTHPQHNDQELFQLCLDVRNSLNNIGHYLSLYENMNGHYLLINIYVSKYKRIAKAFNDADKLIGASMSANSYWIKHLK